MAGMTAAGLPWVALVLVHFFFASYGVILGKFSSNGEVDPLVFCLYRDAGAFFVLLIATLVAEKSIIAPPLQCFPLFMALGFTGMFSAQLLYILGIFYAGPVVVSIFQPAIAVWTTLLAIITKVEPFPPLHKLRGLAKVLGILLAVCGAVIMVVKKFEDKSTSQDKKSMGEQFLGSIFSLGNTLMTAIYLLLQKRFIFKQSNSIWKYRPVGVTTWSYCFGAIFLGFSSLYNVNKPENFTSFAQQQVYPLIYAIFITSALCYLLVTWCNMQISSSLVSASWPLQTLFSSILSYIFLSDVMQPTEYIGGALIISGMVAVVWSNYADERDLHQLHQLEDPGYSRVPTTSMDKSSKSGGHYMLRQKF